MASWNRFESDDDDDSDVDADREDLLDQMADDAWEHGLEVNEGDDNAGLLFS